MATTIVVSKTLETCMSVATLVCHQVGMWVCVAAAGETSCHPHSLHVVNHFLQCLQLG